MNQRSPVAVHSLRDARACHACHAYIDVPHAAKDVPPWYSTPQNESLHCQRYKEKKGKTRTDELLPHRESCSCLEEGKSVHRATYCAIARITTCAGGGKSVHRATYCAHNYPLPLLPSGPGGVGGITSRRTRHRNHFTTPGPQETHSRIIGFGLRHYVLVAHNSTPPSPFCRMKLCVEGTMDISRWPSSTPTPT